MVEQIITATPKSARRLLNYMELSEIPISDDFKALADKDRLSPINFANCPVCPSNEQIKVLQSGVDNNNRFLILTDDSDYKETAILTTWSVSNKILIISKPDSFLDWADAIHKIYPDENVLVYPYTVSKKDTVSENITISSEYKSSNIIVTNLDYIIRQEDIDNSYILICDDFKKSDALYGFINEFSKVVSIVNIHNISPIQNIDNETLIYTAVNSTGRLLELMNNTTSSDVIINTYSMSKIQKETKRFDIRKILNLYGVDTALIPLEENTIPIPNITFNDTTISTLKSINSPNNLIKSSLREYLIKEKEITSLTGSTIEDFISNIMSNKINKDSIEYLYTQSWCELKTKSLISTVINNFSNYSKRFLITAQNDILLENLTSMIAGLLNYDSIKRKNEIIGKYLSCRDDESFWSNGRFMAFNPNITLQDDILKNTDYMVMMEYPTDINDFINIIDMCYSNNIILINLVIKGSFEEHIVDNLHKLLKNI